MTAALPTEIRGGGRHVVTLLDPQRAQTRVFDMDYQIELEPIQEEALKRAAQAGGSALQAFVARALREPTSLELLYYAQVGGPHVRGET